MRMAWVLLTTLIVSLPIYGQRTDLIANEEFSGERAFCVVVGVDGSNSVAVRLTLISDPSSGYFDVDGKRLYSWKRFLEPISGPELRERQLRS